MWKWRSRQFKWIFKSFCRRENCFDHNFAKSTNFFVLFSVLNAARCVVYRTRNVCLVGVDVCGNLENLKLFFFLVCSSHTWLIGSRLRIGCKGGRAAAFVVAPKICYFRRARTSCLCSACRACEMLKNAPLDASIRVDTAENRLVKVQVKVKWSKKFKGLIEFLGPLKGLPFNSFEI